MILKMRMVSLTPVQVKTITSTSAVVATALAAGVTNAYALNPYQSGYKQGVNDAQKAAHGLGGGDWAQPGKAFAFHTPEGYVDGFCSIAGPGAGSDVNQVMFKCS